MLIINATGNVGRDPELKTVKDIEVAEFSIAARTGKDETTWLNCSVWGGRSKTVMEYIKKGSQISVSGPGKLVTFEKRDGSTGFRVEVKVNDFTLPVKKEAAPF
jgi:single-strand DNA-binding protein|tara:strand:- start:2394 stop:2705 length:312 start_codon:yes stop_codon:yes gene_type:complete